MDQPQILVDAPDESVDIDVSDLGATTHIVPICPHCNADVSALTKRIENATWKQARKTYRAKLESAREPKPDPTADRVGKLETLVSTALAVLIPGLGAADPSTKKDGTR